VDRAHYGPGPLCGYLANEAPSSEVKHWALLKAPAASTSTDPSVLICRRPLVPLHISTATYTSPDGLNDVGNVNAWAGVPEAIAPLKWTIPPPSLATAALRVPKGALVQLFSSVNGVYVRLSVLAPAERGWAMAVTPNVATIPNVKTAVVMAMTWPTGAGETSAWFSPLSGVLDQQALWPKSAEFSLNALLVAAARERSRSQGARQPGERFRKTASKL
jgi:hypothetical protein